MFSQKDVSKMDQKLEKDFFPEALAANNLEFEKIDDQLTIRKSKNRNTSLQGRIVLSTIGVIIGILLFLFVGSRIGMATIIISGSFLFAFMNMREREKDSEKKSIKIDKEKIEIKTGFKSQRINLADISEFKTTVKKVKNLYLGKITIITEDNWPHEFLEIFGNDEDLVQDDLLIISNHIVDHYLY